MQNVKNRIHHQIHIISKLFLLAMGKKSSFNTAIIKGAAGGTKAVAEAKTRAGEASRGSRHRTTETHSNVLKYPALKTQHFAKISKKEKNKTKKEKKQNHSQLPQIIQARICGSSNVAHHLEHVLERCAAGRGQTLERLVGDR